MNNVVSRLRQQQASLATKPFAARGAKLTRCEQCLLALPWCICAHVPVAEPGVALCLVYYPGEIYKPSNSGRLLADVIADSHAFIWHRTEPPAALLALLQNPDYAPLLVFPYQYAEPQRQLHEEQQLQTYVAGRTPLLLVLDGTWREARKMFRSPWWQHVPVLGVEPQQLSSYALRKAVQAHQLGTAEVMVPLLQRLQQPVAAEKLEGYFERFRRHYLKAKANHIKRPEPDSSAR
ncbi:DTW domain-containing protein [Bacterioplanes sanyensis]|uniref:tRNA-uridine aminocarboxypropyltransferase n=1 Tax=Bacterioplanes sanyensis TaxID=1249553 RepID=A0A222FPP0_9GAMM|nr:DTW domain-containing protein [Bacterioplanes sanyensis]ASP40682.1 DTW domain-containing protein [Bacterioplanes sanyensis]